MNARQVKAEIAELFDRYVLALDYDELDEEWARGIFSDDVLIEFPVSQHDGINGLVEYHQKALSMWARTHHVNTQSIVSIEGDRATIRANMTSVHVHHERAGEAREHYVSGTYVTGDAVRTDRGWRLSRLSFDLIWKTGNPPA
ncbi:nuclear transport factor 2 family protein [Streptomyces sp. NRRL F-5755]|uniref:nuclear transport factor 2 family protein n=1 Tax=Streptomyces sp. NRRL F-5755 TaxID=1519475 RepID=UPI0006ADC742|nr:nuclear transport factor 2 family protein [Streptomyces sp. NRRL F-5755]